MVDGFPTDEFRKWNELFDRVLWVPLRRLKEWSPAQYDLEELFSQLQRIVESGRSLFILDGLDKIAQELSGEEYKSEFLRCLLDQPNVIITSRPHVSLPVGVRPPHLEVETIGFYPDQVKDYLQATFTDPKRVEDVQSYLDAHQLIQDLVRIPIQLDALCYTWDSFGDKTVPQTMTAIYKAIEERLWKKDVLHLGKRENELGELVSKDDIKDEEVGQIKYLVDGEVCLLEGLAFTGMCNDVINFELKHRHAVSKEFTLPHKRVYWDKTLPRLSFLRTSDPSSEDHSRNYHFLHLAFQVYFAARNGRCNNIEPSTFLQKHKYDPRYDIFWRFVADLLGADKEHKGLPDTILHGIVARLKYQDENIQRAAIEALQGRANLTEEMLQGIAARLEDQDWTVRRAAIEALQGQANLTEEMLQGIAARLGDRDGDVRRAAIEVLMNQAALSLDVLSPYVKPFYKALLQKSFKEHLYWQHSRKEAVVKLLMEKGAVTEAKDGDRRLPLHLAAGNWEEVVVKLLTP
ncbi:hypothetical protein DL770_004797 [Monosporascus sp. CRB-9-2]|nr:hypothetical protein DL770_004797 [Monosporascus sp. CRB-9-2]